MRITNTMMANNYLRDMRKNLNNLNTLNGQLTSGKEIRRPSDNPFKVARSMQLHTDINANKQYNNNITDTINFLDATDTALNQLTNVMQRTRELMVSAGNAAYGEDERKAIQEEIKQQTREISQILNTNFDGKYIFGGTKGTSKPTDVQNEELVFVDKAGAKINIPNGDRNQIKMLSSDLVVEISQGVKIEYNVTAMEIVNFKSKEGKEIDFSFLMKDIQYNLKSEDEKDMDKVIGENLRDLDSVISNLMQIRGEVGAMQNRMESALEKNKDENLNMKELLSNNEDIDITEKTMEAAMVETVYIAALQTSAKVLPPTLMDYLR
ncbi:flagellar hook-associated protein FlgL [Clostridium thermobutyricum]|uniref:flagellar hook-associated protein FlgL n=1 Tax=Clostridium thermobutyricum TaxID=29372 RepID=UPI0018AB3E7F|nr:flagellar hook-associated protein FlgL [Clostridium thermobutyricum]